MPENLIDADAINRHRGYLLFLARREFPERLQGKLGPSDVVQQTLLEACRDLDQFRGESSAELAGWLRRILCNTLIDAIRKHQRQGAQTRSLEAAVEDSSARLEAWLAASGSSPDDKVMRQEQLIHLAEALAELSEDQRQAVEMHYLQEEPIAVIAARMERTEASIAGLLRRGLKNLRQLLARDS